ncbi:MAG: hypothetical protein IPL41_01455 [Micropruina sp.]|nr:hypothetical protein [Micropruina sp.]
MTANNDELDFGDAEPTKASEGARRAIELVRAMKAQQVSATPAEPDPSTWAHIDASASIPEADEATDSDWQQFKNDVDDLVRNKGTLTLYRELGGKTQKFRPAKEVQVSCPMPHHTDNTPSCSINTTNGLWYCFTCSISGLDVYAMAAVLLGYDLSTYQQRDNFIALKKDIAQHYGITVPEQTTQVEAALPTPDADPKVLALG